MVSDKISALSSGIFGISMMRQCIALPYSNNHKRQNIKAKTKIKDKKKTKQMSINDLTKMSYFHLDVQYNAHVIGNIKFYGAVILPVKLLRKGGDSILKTFSTQY